MRDVIIVGGGHNGLVTAAYLAQAGMKPLVLERSDRIGGCAATLDLAPGFRAPAFAHRASLDPAIVRALNLERHGLQILRPGARLCAPTPDGRTLTVWNDETRTGNAIAAFSPRDAGRYGPFLRSLANVSRVLRSLLTTRPPDLDGIAASDLVSLLTTARRFRSIPRADAYRLLRWMPMPVADLVGEWFESEPLSALVAADGVLGSFLGPRSAGSGAVLLLRAAVDGHPIAPGWTARGGPGAIAEALAAAAREAGAEIRTMAEVAEIRVEEGAASGVVLRSGEMLPARRVVSNADPRRTLLDLVDPVHLGPELRRRVRNIRMRGTLAKVNYAVSTVPQLPGLRDLPPAARNAALSGCVRLAASTDAIERAFDAAKYGGFSAEPWIELAIPSILDPTLAPAGQHVVSAYVQYAPYELDGSGWDAERERLGDVATRTIEHYAPGFAQSVLARQAFTPLDLERACGLTGGHIFHGELAIDQLFFARPLLGWAQYQLPVRNLFLCGAGAHPGTGLDGLPGMLAARAVIASR